MNTVLAVGERLCRAVDGAASEDAVVVHVSTQRDGIRAFHSHRPTVVIVEQTLADGDGLELVRRIREHDSACEVVFLASAGDAAAALAVVRAGATDYLHSPVEEKDLFLAVRRAEKRQRDLRRASGARVLIVEDHTTTRNRLARVLAKVAYRVHTAATSDDGLRVLRENRIDVVVADVRLPGDSGIDLARQVRRLDTEAVVVMVTGSAEEETVVEALRAGAVGYLRKPVDLDDLFGAIATALERQEARRDVARRHRSAAQESDVVVRVTRRQALVMEAPAALPPATLSLCRRVLGAMACALIVVDTEQRVVVADSRVPTCAKGDRFDAAALASWGVAGIEDAELTAELDRIIAAPSSEPVSLGDGPVATMCAVTVQTGAETRRLIAVAVPTQEES